MNFSFICCALFPSGPEAVSKVLGLAEPPLSFWVKTLPLVSCLRLMGLVVIWVDGEQLQRQVWCLVLWIL